MHLSQDKILKLAEKHGLFQPDDLMNTLQLCTFSNVIQSQSANAALEKAAKEIDSMVQTYIASADKHEVDSVDRERCVNKARAAMSCAETIRALMHTDA